jgi:hypothetical protein
MWLLADARSAILSCGRRDCTGVVVALRNGFDPRPR